MARPSRTVSVEARENQLAALAMDLAEKQIREGTASPLIINHFLKVGSSREKKELELLNNKTKLTSSQTDALESQKKQEELYANAIRAMGIYSGNGVPDEIDD